MLRYFFAVDELLAYRNWNVGILIFLLMIVWFSGCSLAPHVKKDRWNRYKKLTSKHGNLDKGRSGMEGSFDLGDETDHSSEVEVQREKMKKNISEALSEDYLVEDDQKDLLHFWIAYFSQGQRQRERFNRHFRNGEKYRQLVEAIFDQYNLPSELFYVGLIESGYNLIIKSHAQAVGPWQFIPGTARRYGLQVNSHLDERRSIFKSTHAAALYLKDLYNIFGDWPLALAAYNSGEYKVLNAIRSGKSRNYRELSQKRLLPRETREYLPKLIAAKKIVEEQYLGRQEDNWNSEGNIQLLVDSSEGDKVVSPMDLENTSYYTLTFNTSLQKLVEVGSVPRQVILDYNPDIKGHYIPASPERPFRIYLPENHLQTLAANLQSDSSSAAMLAQIPRGDDEERASGKKSRRLRRLAAAKIKHSKLKAKNAAAQARVYIVKKGDSLFKIANRFNIPVKELMAINSLDSKRIFPKQRILVPGET